MECITTARMNVLWNGEFTGDFTPSRGIQQGDPISLYLFVLCIERLSHAICSAVNAGKWKPIRLSRQGTPLTYLFFADDLLLFAEASHDQAQIINAVLGEFCCSSGEKVNNTKTSIFFSSNVSAVLSKSISKALGFTISNNLGRYLGMPLLHSRVTKNTYQDIVDKVEKRLSSWNASHLSLAGPITLTQSVLQALPIFAMQTTNLPDGVQYKVDQACRRFLWSGNNKERKLSQIS